MRRIAILGLALLALALGGILGYATVARAEETPVNVPLAYVPNLSNWGPTTAIGTASVWRQDAEVRLKVQGLPVLSNQAYGLWLVNPQAGQFLAVGRFNVGADGTAQLDVTLPGSLPSGYTMVLITVQPDPEPNHSLPSKVYSIAGSFQGNSPSRDQVKQLPDTGSLAPSPSSTTTNTPAESVPGGLLVLLVGMASLLFVWRHNHPARKPGTSCAAREGPSQLHMTHTERIRPQMLRGLYTATAGMTSDMAALDLIANNVANTNAIGYKSDFELLVRRSANPLSYGMGGLVVGTGVLQVQQSLDLSQGALNQTGRPFDLALQGPGMFAVQAPNGTVTYVRDGRFHLTAQRQLANDAGQLALSPSGQPIQLPDSQGATYDIKTDGTVNVNNGAVGQIGVFNAPGGWQKSGNGLFAPVGTAQAITTTPIRQGMVENANIDLVRTMGTMMSVQRSYEASSQLQHAEDQLLQQGANDVGRITG